MEHGTAVHGVDTGSAHSVTRGSTGDADEDDDGDADEDDEDDEPTDLIAGLRGEGGRAARKAAIDGVLKALSSALPGQMQQHISGTTHASGSMPGNKSGNLSGYRRRTG